MKNPTLNGWVWEIPFTPWGYGDRDNICTIKSIFWYDSSNEMEFTKHQHELQILIPEHLIQGNKESIEWVRNNKEVFIQERRFILETDRNGNWFLI